MQAPETLKDRILNIDGKDEFRKLALELFQLHYKENEVYRAYVDALPDRFSRPEDIDEIPCLPIEFFKKYKIGIPTDNFDEVFESSGTTGANTSKHYVQDGEWYIEQSIRNFEDQYGPLKDFCILALLPSYLERSSSSLVYMAKAFMERSNSKQSGFYLNEFDALFQVLKELKQKGEKTLLLGVSFALLDFGAAYKMDHKDLILMETGGMKGRRKEMIRKELHAELKASFGLEKVHSEYGMTELLSQAYSKGDGIFNCPPWMKILIRDSEDPLSYIRDGLTGGISVIDLANYSSCPFIATQDLGKIHPQGVEILGRFDNSDIRGCSLLTI